MQNIARRIQLFFWDYIIMLLSESKLMRSLIPAIYKYYHQYKEGLQVSIALLVCGMVGLVAGRLLIHMGITSLLH